MTISDKNRLQINNSQKIRLLYINTRNTFTKKI